MTSESVARRGSVAPLLAAGFVTAFGSHSVAANLGVASEGSLGDQLFAVGVLLALYDGAEVLLKPVFGAVADRIGPRPVLLGGLVGFAAASVVFVLAGAPATLGVARFAQGAAAAAFSPAAGAMIARLAPRQRQASLFGRYGGWKSLGYAAGPLLGGVLVSAGGLTALFAVLTVVAAAVAVWAAVAVPRLDPLPRRRQTVLDLVRRLTDRGFLPPTAALAASTAALSCGVGFLPLVGAGAGLGPVATGTVVSVLAVVGAVAQPLVGRLRDRERLGDRTALVGGILVSAAGLALPALLPSLLGLIPSAVAIGIGTAMITPVAFAVLASSGPPDRLGETMGSAEVGRELGEAGGPFLAGAFAAGGGLGAGFLGIAALVALTAPGAGVVRRTPTAPESPS